MSGCRLGLLCVSCRGTIAYLKRAVFCRARCALLAEAERHGLLNFYRRGGRFGEKFLTLTAPHVRGDTIARRIERVFDAWPQFLRLLNDYFRELDIKSAEYFRVFEWTPGDDAHGHPHLHVWLFCPFLDHGLLRDWWSASLVAAGCPLELAQQCIVDIREVSGADGGARELIKYLTKDITAKGKKLEPELYAQVYMALDGRRITQASKGFMARAQHAGRVCECGAELPLSVTRVRKEKGPRDDG